MNSTASNSIEIKDTPQKRDFKYYTKFEKSRMSQEPSEYKAMAPTSPSTKIHKTLSEAIIPKGPMTISSTSTSEEKDALSPLRASLYTPLKLQTLSRKEKHALSLPSIELPSNFKSIQTRIRPSTKNESKTTLPSLESILSLEENQIKLKTRNSAPVINRNSQLIRSGRDSSVSLQRSNSKKGLATSVQSIKRKLARKKSPVFENNLQLGPDLEIFLPHKAFEEVTAESTLKDLKSFIEIGAGSLGDFNIIGYPDNVPITPIGVISSNLMEHITDVTSGLEVFERWKGDFISHSTHSNNLKQELIILSSKSFRSKSHLFASIFEMIHLIQPLLNAWDIKRKWLTSMLETYNLYSCFNLVMIKCWVLPSRKLGYCKKR